MAIGSSNVSIVFWEIFFLFLFVSGGGCIVESAGCILILYIKLAEVNINDHIFQTRSGELLWQNTAA
jgi:hypothetical protein